MRTVALTAFAAAAAALALAACTPRDQAGDQAARDSGMPAAMPDTNAPLPPPPTATVGAAQDTMLENTEWSLVELGGKPMLGAGNRPLTLRLDPAGKRASGFAGCNRYSGSYELAGNSLKFGPTIMTKMACDQGMDAESAWADALGRVTAWRISGGNLELLAGDSVLAKFRAAA